MTYFNGGTGGYYWMGKYVPLEKTTRILCDDCAEKELPLKPKGAAGRHWGTGFKWAPRYGAKCSRCERKC
jgi:hypothetical protein